MPRRIAHLALVLAAVVTVASCGSGGASKPEAYHGYTISPPPSVDTGSLPNVAADGTPATFKANAGGLLLVYFGYTSCPDICPTTLADVKKALGQLGAEAAKVQLAMVTVDPIRDTAPVLTAYVQGFVPGSLALRTDDDVELRKVAESFGASYSVEQAGGGSDERVAHSTTLYAVNDQGKVVVAWPFGMPAADMAHDIRLYLSGKQVA